MKYLLTSLLLICSHSFANVDVIGVIASTPRQSTALISVNGSRPVLVRIGDYGITAITHDSIVMAGRKIDVMRPPPKSVPAATIVPVQQDQVPVPVSAALDVSENNNVKFRELVLRSQTNRQ
jgi:hypothetical protein